MKAHKEQRPPIIHGLLREGETMNIIAAPKVGKSWLVYDLALSVVTGGKWLGEYQTVQGDVLLIDNELYPESLATRIPKVAEALGLQTDQFAKGLAIKSLRGELQDIVSLNSYFAQFKPCRFKVVIIDAFYRALPPGVDENDNAGMAAVYNQIDKYAKRLGCAFVLIHHASKGNQSGKSITDVGSGAGSQSRAADTHLILRPHEEPGVVVLDAAVRSWPSVQPVCLRWQFPAWEVASDLDPTDLRKDTRGRGRDKADGSPAPWTPERFAATFATAIPAPKLAIIDAAIKGGLSDRKAKDLFGRAEAIRHLHDHGGKLFATVAAEAADEEAEATSQTFFKADAVVEELRRNPSSSNREIAQKCGVSHTYVTRKRAEVAK